jgi:hypothetical protein
MTIIPSLIQTIQTYNESLDLCYLLLIFDIIFVYFSFYYSIVDKMHVGKYINIMNNAFDLLIAWL